MPTVLHWFRHDLRLHDNPTLCASLTLAEREGAAWLPVWWAGERWSGASPWGVDRAGAHRQGFLHQALADLSRSLHALGSGLVVLRQPSPPPLMYFDVYSNTGNWLYIAGRGTDPRGGRAFNLAHQTQAYDSDGSYRSRWNTASCNR